MPRPKRIITKEVVAETPQQTKINTEIAVTSLYDAHLKYIGTISGQEYEWRHPGSTVMVLAEDVPYLLEKRIGTRSCCGALNENGNPVFEINKEAQ